MAAAASKFNFNQGPPKGRGEIKLKIFKTIAKSLQNLATGVPGEGKKVAGNRVDSSGCCSSTVTVIPVELVGELQPASKHEIKQNQPRRGQIKIKIFNMITKSVKSLAVRAAGLAGGKKKGAGNGDGARCFSSPAVIIPVESIGRLKTASGREIKQNLPERSEIKIKICKTISGSVFWFSESGGKEEMDVGRYFSSTAGIVPMKIANGWESEKLCY
ncbi:hypothetical protein L2E82_20586 [Cichorium intybus]|uniref:Uncharacterized protein n=1 Tax=Cichorium intybus TaxID=13427 RepID=A0ACB9DTG3_CICIN|nr:hypothetical protein L2E82_20586 [Cichorium intybus]